METHKNPEIAVVRSLVYVLDYYDKNPNADIEEILKNLSKELSSMNVKKDSKIIAIASANEALKIKKICKGLNNKQIVGGFVSRLPKFLKNIKKEQEIVK